MTAFLFTACGEALYGPRWQSDLARKLGVDDRTVRRWVAGDVPVPAGVWVDLLRLMKDRAAALDELSATIRSSAKRKRK